MWSASNNYGSQQFPFVAHYHPNGTLDSTFVNCGTNKITNIGANKFLSVYLMPNGKILCTNGNLALRFQNDAGLDLCFGTNGLINISSPPDISFFY